MISSHLEELRQRLLVSFGAIIFFAALSYFYAEQIARLCMTPLFTAHPALIKLVYTNLTEAFITYLKLSLLAGIIFSIPVLIYEAWMYTAPGLHENERKILIALKDRLTATTEDLSKITKLSTRAIPDLFL